MTVTLRHAVGVLAVAVAALTTGAGCAKDSTSVLVTVDADPSVPPILILRTTVARVSDPSVKASANRSSSNESDAADRPGPFVFPLDVSLTVDPSFAGAVLVTVDGLDWDTLAVIGSGSTGAAVLAQQQTRAAVTLVPVRGGGGDAGAD